MKDKLLTALLDLRIAIGQLQGAMVDVEKAARELMAVILEVKTKESEPDEPPPGSTLQ